MATLKVRKVKKRYYLEKYTKGSLLINTNVWALSRYESENLDYAKFRGSRVIRGLQIFSRWYLVRPKLFPWVFPKFFLVGISRVQDFFSRGCFVSLKFFLLGIFRGSKIFSRGGKLFYTYRIIISIFSTHPP